MGARKPKYDSVSSVILLWLLVIGLTYLLTSGPNFSPLIEKPHAYDGFYVDIHGDYHLDPNRPENHMKMATTKE